MNPYRLFSGIVDHDKVIYDILNDPYYTSHTQITTKHIARLIAKYAGGINPDDMSWIVHVIVEIMTAAIQDEKSVNIPNFMTVMPKHSNAVYYIPSFQYRIIDTIKVSIEERVQSQRPVLKKSRWGLKMRLSKKLKTLLSAKVPPKQDAD